MNIVTMYNNYTLIFEQESEFNENQPSDFYVSQYPLEDILDKFNCSCGDFYEDENKKIL